MTIFLRELKARRNSLIIWSVSMVALVYLSMAKYGALSEGDQVLSDLVAQLPDSVQAFFGMSGLNVTTLRGYYGVVFLFVALLGSVHAGMLGADLLAREERDKTSEFLYTRPVSRRYIMVNKALAGLVNVVALNAVTTVGSLLAVSQFSSSGSINDELRLLMVAFLLLQLTYFLAGLALAAVLPDPKRPGKAAGVLIFLGYLVYVVTSIQPSLAPLRYLSPLSWFDAKFLLRDMRFEAVYLTIAAGLAIGCALATWFANQRRDLAV